MRTVFSVDCKIRWVFILNYLAVYKLHRLSQGGTHKTLLQIRSSDIQMKYLQIHKLVKQLSRTEVECFLQGFVFICCVFCVCLGSMCWIIREEGGSCRSPGASILSLLGGNWHELGNAPWYWLPPFKQVQHIFVHVQEWCACKLRGLHSLYWELAVGKSSTRDYFGPLCFFRLTL